MNDTIVHIDHIYLQIKNKPRKPKHNNQKMNEITILTT